MTAVAQPLKYVLVAGGFVVGGDTGGDAGAGGDTGSDGNTSTGGNTGSGSDAGCTVNEEV